VALTFTIRRLIVFFALAGSVLAGCEVRPEGLEKTSQTAIKTDGRPDFDSYDEAKGWVRGNRRLQHEQADTSRSSLIRAADYYATPDDATGYLILNLQGREYLYERVPRDVWLSLQAAKSMRSVYNYQIKGRYGLRLDDTSSQ
jgi:hypothetical protein